MFKHFFFIQTMEALSIKNRLVRKIDFFSLLGVFVVIIYLMLGFLNIGGSESKNSTSNFINNNPESFLESYYSIMAIVGFIYYWFFGTNLKLYSRYQSLAFMPVKKTSLFMSDWISNVFNLFSLIAIFFAILFIKYRSDHLFKLATIILILWVILYTQFIKTISWILIMLFKILYTDHPFLG